MTDVQVNPGKDIASGRLQQSETAAAQQTGWSRSRAPRFLHALTFIFATDDNLETTIRGPRAPPIGGTRARARLPPF
ncbi:hypothetical protein P5V15_004017 [Pogonomyrmex californicus]